MLTRIFKLKPIFLILLFISGTVMAKPVWIDVRTAEEYAAGHLEGSVNIPYENIVEEIDALASDKDADIRVYCRSGNRSGIAKNMLEAQGFTNVTNEGGYQDLLKRN